jgi:hypothetical protein
MAGLLSQPNQILNTEAQRKSAAAGKFNKRTVTENPIRVHLCPSVVSILSSAPCLCAAVFKNRRGKQDGGFQAMNPLHLCRR